MSIQPWIFNQSIKIRNRGSRFESTIQNIESKWITGWINVLKPEFKFWVDFLKCHVKMNRWFSYLYQIMIHLIRAANNWYSVICKKLVVLDYNSKFPKKRIREILSLYFYRFWVYCFHKKVFCHSYFSGNFAKFIRKAIL